MENIPSLRNFPYFLNGKSTRFGKKLTNCNLEKKNLNRKKKGKKGKGQLCRGVHEEEHCPLVKGGNCSTLHCSGTAQVKFCVQFEYFTIRRTY